MWVYSARNVECTEKNKPSSTRGSAKRSSRIWLLELSTSWCFTHKPHHLDTTWKILLKNFWYYWTVKKQKHDNKSDWAVDWRDRRLHVPVQSDGLIPMLMWHQPDYFRRTWFIGAPAVCFYNGFLWSAGGLARGETFWLKLNRSFGSWRVVKAA